MAKYKWNKNMQDEFANIIDKNNTEDNYKPVGVVQSKYLEEYLALSREEFNCSDSKKKIELIKKIESIRVKMYDELKSTFKTEVKISSQHRHLEEPKMDEQMEKYKAARKTLESFYKSSFKPIELELESRLKDLKAKKKSLMLIRNKLYTMRKLESFTADEAKIFETFDVENFRV